METKVSAKPWYDTITGVETLTAEGVYETCFVYGMSGIGKTTSLRSLIEAVGREKVCILAPERRQLPLTKLHPHILPIPDAPALDHAIELLETLVEKNMSRPEYVAIDDLTSYCDKMKKFIYKIFPSKEKSYDRWEEFADRILTSLARLRDMPYNVIVLCQASKSGTFDQQGGPVYVPEVHGNKLPRRLPGLFDEYFFMTQVEDPDLPGKYVRVFQTAQVVGDGTIAKDSAGVLAPYEKPNWGRIFSKLLASKTEE